jgi:hypothetical protein
MDETYLHRLSRPYRPVARNARPAGESPDVTVVAHVPEPERPARRRRVVTSCEVCGRTLLTGERAREIARGERVVWACPLCVIGAQHDLPRAA